MKGAGRHFLLQIPQESFHYNWHRTVRVVSESLKHFCREQKIGIIAEEFDEKEYLSDARFQLQDRNRSMNWIKRNTTGCHTSTRDMHSRSARQ